MATTSLYLDTRGLAPSQAGPLRIVIRHNNTSSSISLGIQLTKNQWDGKAVSNRPDWRMLNTIITKKKTDIEAAILTLSLTRDLSRLTASQLKEEILSSLFERPQKRILFTERFERFARMRNAQGTQDLYLQTLSKIRSFCTNANRLTFEDITKDWLERFDLYLKETTSPNIRNRHFRNIRAVFNDALNEDLIKCYPFKSFKLPKLQQTKHRALTKSEIVTLRDYPCMDWQTEYRDLFLLSFYLVGINMVDLLTARKEDVRNGRLEYRRDKTGKLYSIKIEPEAQEIIDRYRGKDYLLSPMERYSNHKDYIQHMNRALKKIGLYYETSSRKTGKAIFPDLTTYWARHTWTSLASAIDIPIDIIARSLGHSWIDKTVTSVYIDFDPRKLDDANRKVLDYLQ